MIIEKLLNLSKPYFPHIEISFVLIVLLHRTVGRMNLVNPWDIARRTVNAQKC